MVHSLEEWKKYLFYQDEGKDENDSSEEEENVQMEVDVDRKYY